MRTSRRKLAAVVTAAALVAAACTPGDGDPAAQDGPPSSASQAQEPAAAPDSDVPDTADIPDPVAEVNGTPIAKSAFVNVLRGQQQQAQLAGATVDQDDLREQALEGLVGVELLRQEATARGIDVTDAEVDEALAGFAAANQVSTDEFVTTMGEQGMDRDGVLEQIRTQLAVEKLVADEYGEVQPGEDEVRAAYDRVAAQQAAAGAQGGSAQVPPFEQVRDQVEAQVRAEKEAGYMQEFSEKLRGDARVDVHL